ncbi:MAG: ROK family glucokinase [Lachnospiraceae bacterium]
MKYGFGVDIGGTTVKIGFFEETGKLLEKWEIKTNTANGGAAILDDVAAAIAGKLEEKQVAKADVLGVGVGVPGPVTAEGVVKKCVNLGWGVFNVEEALSEKCGFPVKAGNDANVAALGEMWQGGGKGYKDVIMVTLGTGVGGGIILNGKIIAGANGAGGEIGHILVDETETEVCGCGKKGCLEQYTSATGIVRMAKRELAVTTEKTSLTGFDPLTAKDIFDEAKKGDAVAVKLVEKLGNILGKALGAVACVVDPQVFVIGGGVSKAGQILLDVIEKNYKEATFHACRDAKFALASLGNDAGMYGCMQMVLGE